MLEFENKHLDKIIIAGDRVLVKPKSQLDRTKAGLYLPSTVKEKEEVNTGYVIKVGPGIPIPFAEEDDEPWKKNNKKSKYIPLQAEEGDLVLYLNKSGIEIEINKEIFFIVPQNAILLMYRDND